VLALTGAERRGDEPRVLFASVAIAGLDTVASLDGQNPDTRTGLVDAHQGTLIERHFMIPKGCNNERLKVARRDVVRAYLNDARHLVTTGRE
jgi:hypothetical protein